MEWSFIFLIRGCWWFIIGLAIVTVSDAYEKKLKAETKEIEARTHQVEKP